MFSSHRFLPLEAFKMLVWTVWIPFRYAFELLAEAL